MTGRDARKYLVDITQAADRLNDFTTGKSFADYAEEALLRAAVERQFEIIGEALNRLLNVDPSLSSRITSAGRIVAFRNKLIHGYASIADDVVWGVLETYLPTLEVQVKALLDELETDEG